MNIYHDKEAGCYSGGDVYDNTINRLEPDIAMIDAGAGWASCAISLKRIADASEKLVVGLVVGGIVSVNIGMWTLIAVWVFK